MFCPICQDTCREISVTLGPDGVVTPVHLMKLDENLQLVTSVQIREDKYSITFNIDCIKNTFEFIISDKVSNPKDFVEKAARSSLFFFVESDCKKCMNSWTNGKDIELNFLTKKIENIGLEREEIWLTKTKDKFLVAYEYIEGYMSIDKLLESFDFDGLVGHHPSSSPTKLPITELDFKNYNKIINKIKTVLVFS